MIKVGGWRVVEDGRGEVSFKKKKYCYRKFQTFHLLIKVHPNGGVGGLGDWWVGGLGEQSCQYFRFLKQHF